MNQSYDETFTVGRQHSDLPWASNDDIGSYHRDEVEQSGGQRLLREGVSSKHGNAGQLQQEGRAGD